MATTTGQVEGVFDLARPSRSLWGDALRRLMRNKMAVAGVCVIVFFALVALVAPLLADAHVIPAPDFQSRARPERGNGGADLPPVWDKEGKAGYVLGTDNLGRDILSRIMFGARVSMVVGFIPMIIIVFLGVVIGLVAGYRGGWIDSLLMRVTDITYAFPDILFVLILVGALRDTPVANFLGGLPLIFGALAIVGWVGVARLVRGQVLSLREKEFIEAARSIGTPDWRIMLTHLFPNSLAPVIVVATFAVPGFILTEAFLSFIGIGVKPPTPTWGSLINAGYTSINSSPHEVWIPAICIGMLTLSFVFLGDGLRDALDPRMKI
ncbi:MAG TPA: ABC transporter permease [Chloroflexia bacterium]|nr:ABC transporter permease [Chloroflexia bacterium]